jgi:hypothetical protein
MNFGGIHTGWQIVADWDTDHVHVCGRYRKSEWYDPIRRPDSLYALMAAIADYRKLRAIHGPDKGIRLVRMYIR